MRNVLLFLLLSTGPALAANDTPPATGYDACMEAAGTTQAIVACIGQETAVQDASLNQHYQQAMQALAPEQRDQLRAAQRLWVQLRDADCRLFGSLSGGSVDQIAGADCLLEHTRTRSELLERLTGQEQ